MPGVTGAYLLNYDAVIQRTSNNAVVSLWVTRNSTLVAGSSVTTTLTSTPSTSDTNVGRALIIYTGPPDIIQILMEGNATGSSISASTSLAGETTSASVTITRLA